MQDNVKHKFLTLDGMRGIVACLVLMHHAKNMFGAFNDGEIYLAVDLFFVLSGFVIAEAYSLRVQNGLGFLGFMRIRLVRLYPLYVLGIGLGLLAAIGSLSNPLSGAHWTITSLTVSFVVGMLFLPSPITSLLYPINGPAWSLFFELIANALYHLFFRWLNTVSLMAVVLVSALLLIVSARQNGTLDAGYEWSSVYVGIARVMYSFFVGLLLHRLPKKTALSNSVCCLCLIAVTMGLLCGPAGDVAWKLYYDTFLILVCIPFVIWMASRFEPSSPWMAKGFSFLGVTSYGIYVLHLPVTLLIHGIAKRVVGVDPSEFAPTSGMAVVFVLFALVWFVDRWFDRPMRKWLNHSFSG